MSHHRRGKPKDARSGCLLCKPHKSNASKDGKDAKTRRDLRADLEEQEQRSCARHSHAPGQRCIACAPELRGTVPKLTPGSEPS